MDEDRQSFEQLHTESRDGLCWREELFRAIEDLSPPDPLLEKLPSRLKEKS